MFVCLFVWRSRQDSSIFGIYPICRHLLSHIVLTSVDRVDLWVWVSAVHIGLSCSDHLFYLLQFGKSLFQFSGSSLSTSPLIPLFCSFRNPIIKTGIIVDFFRVLTSVNKSKLVLWFQQYSQLRFNSRFQCVHFSLNPPFRFTCQTEIIQHASNKKSKSIQHLKKKK